MHDKFFTNKPWLLNASVWLTATLRKNRLCATATDAEISGIPKDWFQFAADREGGRKKREDKRKHENEKRQLTLILMINLCVWKLIRYSFVKKQSRPAHTKELRLIIVLCLNYYAKYR